MVEPPPQASRQVTLLVWAAAAVVLLLASPVFLVRFILTREWLEARVLPGIETAVGREIGFERLRVGFRGLVLEKLVVSEHRDFPRDDDPDFATLERLVLGVRWLPLLRGQVILDSVSLDNPVLILHRNSGGVINIADSPLLTGEHSDEAAAGNRREPDGAPPAIRQPAARRLRLDARRIDIHNGRIVWLDAMSETAISRIELRRVYLTADDVSTAAAFGASATLDLSAGMDAADPIEIDARVDIPSSQVQLIVHAEAIDTDAYAEAIAMVRERERAAPERADARTPRGQAATRTPEVRALLQVAALTGWGVPVEEVSANLRYHDGVVDAPTFSAKLGSGNVRGSASGDWNGPRPSYRAEVNAEALPLEKLAGAVATNHPRLHDMRGTLSASVTYSGSGRMTMREWATGKTASGEALSIASLLLEDASFRVGDPEATGLLVSDAHASAGGCSPGKPCSAEVSGNFVHGADEPVHFGGKLKLVPSAASLEVDAGVVRLDFDAIEAAIGGWWGYDDSSIAGPPAAAADPFPLRLRGSVAAESVRLAGVEAGPIRTAFDYRSPVLKLEDLSGQIAGGALKASATTDFDARSVDGKVRLKGADFRTLAAPLWKASWGDLGGKLDLDGRARASWPDWRQSLLGNAVVTIDDGAWQGGTLLDTLAREFSASPLSQLELRDSGGRLGLANGRVSSDRFLLGGPAARLVSSGWVAWSGDLNLDARIGIAPSATTGSLLSLAEWTRGADGWSTIPVEIGGTISAPKATLPTGELIGRAIGSAPLTVGRSATRGAGKVLKGIGGLLGSGGK